MMRHACCDWETGQPVLQNWSPKGEVVDVLAEGSVKGVKPSSQPHQLPILSKHINPGTSATARPVRVGDQIDALAEIRASTSQTTYYRRRHRGGGVGMYNFLSRERIDSADETATGGSGENINWSACYKDDSSLLATVSCPGVRHAQPQTSKVLTTATGV